MVKIGIYCDTLRGMGGAEKVVVQLANALGAEIITAGYDSDKLIIKPQTKVNDIGNWSVKYCKPIGSMFEAPLDSTLVGQDSRMM